MDAANWLVEVIVRINRVVYFGIRFRRMSIGYKNIALGNDTTEISLDNGLLCNEVLVDMVADLSSI